MSSDESSEYESTSSESSQEVLKPVFLKKGKKAEADTTSVQKDPSKSIISKLESQANTTTDVSENDVFEGADDTDDIDPEAEFEQWKERERQRFLRDRKVLEEQEKEKEAKLRGVKRGAEELDEAEA